MAKLLAKLEKKDEKPYHVMKKAHLKNLPIDIDFNLLDETKDLQHGKCIMIEHKKEFLEKRGIRNNSQHAHQIDGELKFQFVKQEEMDTLNRKFLVFKARKMNQL
jgi:hypothetical protein